MREGTEGYTLLPTITLSYLNRGQLYFYYQTRDDIQLRYYNSTGTAIATTLNFNIADVPPFIYVKYPNVNWNNYNNVARLLEFQAVLTKKSEIFSRIPWYFVKRGVFIHWNYIH